MRDIGKYHDLGPIFCCLNESFFAGAVDAQIRWGRRITRRRKWFRRSVNMTLGSYCRRRKLITIHPNLDRPLVPRYFVEAIIFHEMCHQITGGEVVNGRRRLHTRQFKEQEIRYPEFEKARIWAKKNLRYLLQN